MSYQTATSCTCASTFEVTRKTLCVQDFRSDCVPSGHIEDPADRLWVGALVCGLERLHVPPAACAHHVLDRKHLPARGPRPPEAVPPPSFGGGRFLVQEARDAHAEVLLVLRFWL